MNAQRLSARVASRSSVPATVLATALALMLLGAGCSDDARSFIDAGVNADASPGGPVADFPAALAIGAAGCGVTRSESFTVRNSGGGDLTYAITSSNAAFAITPATGTIIAGTSTTFAAAVSLPSSTAAGTQVTATLTVTSNLPGAAALPIAVSVTATGAQIATEAVTFGDAVVGQPASRDVVIRNFGNAPATVQIAAPSDDHFAVTWPGAPAAVEIAGGGATLAATARFTPAVAGAASATAALTVTGAICGAPPAASLALSGTGVAADTFRVTGGAAFGTVVCGAAAGTAPLEVINGTGHTVTWRAVLDDISASQHYAVAPASGTLAAGATQAVTVSRLAIGLPAAPARHDTHLTFTATAKGEADEVRVVDVSQTLAGPFLVAPALPAIDFGFLPADRRRERIITLRNSGTAPAVLTSVPPTHIAVVLPAEIPVGQSAAVTVAYAPAVTPAVVVDPVVIAAPGLCSDPVTQALAAGTGAFAEIEAITLDGTCPAREPFAQIAVANLGNRALTLNGCAELTASDVEPVFHGEQFPMVLGASPGSNSEGSLDLQYTPRSRRVESVIACDIEGDPFQDTTTTTVTRALVGADIEVSIPDGASLDFVCLSDALTVPVTYRNTGSSEVLIVPVILGDEFPFPIDRSAAFFGPGAVVQPGATFPDEALIQHNGDGSGSGGYCDQPGGVPPRTGIVTAADVANDMTLPICSVTELPMTLTNNRPQDQ